jgi:hypothetical protein
LAQLDSSGTVALLERMKEKIAVQEALAEPYGEVAQAGKSIDAEVDQALGTSGAGKAKRQRQALAGTEAQAEVTAQIKLFDQAWVNYLDLCDAPTKCDDYSTKVMVQLEEREGKFPEFDQFLRSITSATLLATRRPLSCSATSKTSSRPTPC